MSHHLYQKALDEAAQVFDVIPKGDPRIATYSEDTTFRGNPEAVIRARDEKDLRDAIIFCHRNKIPMTFCGSRTSMTGASIPTEGVVISTERLEGVLHVGSVAGHETITVRSGTITAVVQKAAEEAGYFFPVAPTSRDDCRIGANVATNATGEDSFKYGPIRPYVRRLKIFLADGTEKILERSADEHPSWDRNRGGYFLDWTNPIDLIVGSEGTLCFVSEVTLDVVDRVPFFFSALLPFQSDRAALQCIISVAASSKLSPRALELVDSHALDVMRTYPGFPVLPVTAKALVYIKQEYRDEKDKEAWLMRWYEEVQKTSTPQLAESILIAQTEKERDSFRLWRHHIPQTVNERARQCWDDGGGKVGSDWWVPIHRLMEMMDYFYLLADAVKLPYMAYAHVGSGHPHTNVLAKNAQEMAIAEDMLLKCCRKAVELGGGVAGEHGVGKIHKNLLPIQHPSQAIAKMRKWKEEYDPHFLLGRGNIF